jgi:hypothetical protein
MRTLASFTLDLAGPGFVIYSPFAMADVATGSHFLRDHYTEPADVAAYVRAGRVAGCCTGSPGTYNVEIIDGALDHFMAALCPWWISLSLEVRDRTVCVRDLFDLTPWDPVCPPKQSLSLADGFYRLAVGTRPTESGIVGRDQDLVIAFERRDALPELNWTGVPFLGKQA